MVFWAQVRSDNQLFFGSDAKGFIRHLCEDTGTERIGRHDCNCVITRLEQAGYNNEQERAALRSAIQTELRPAGARTSEGVDRMNDLYRAEGDCPYRG